MKVYKYTLAEAAEQALLLPRGARILSAAAQGDFICVWALVEPGEPNVSRTAYIVPTGTPVPDRVANHFGDTDGPQFCGTVLLAGGALVFQVFVEDEK